MLKSFVLTFRNQEQMMTKNGFLPVFVCALIFTLIFNRRDLGLNLFLMEMLVLAWLILSGKINFRLKNHLIFGSGLLLTSLAVILVYSPYVIAINFLALFILIGVLIYPQAKSLATSFGLSFYNLVYAQSHFFSQLSQSRDGKQPSKRRRRLTIFFIPLLIIIFFVLIYRGSNPFFNALAGKVGTFFSDYVFSVFDHLDMLAIFTFIIGLILCNYCFFRIPNPDIVKNDQLSTDELSRPKRNKFAKFRFSGLKDELKAGIFLLLILNVILCIVNALDVYWVWFNFTWNGLYLKQFVHEGTYLLLLSIICSIIIVLYFFRGNLNFYGQSKTLRTLSYLWLAQNGILTISVAVRNFHYIHYFALAYRRIGLMLFLILTLYGLYTVYVKVSQKKSSFYLFRTNLFAVYLVLVSSALLNWENIIARYDFKNADKSYVHLDYMSDFPNKSLPYIAKTPEELTAIKNFQKTKFPFENEDLTQDAYYKAIERRKIAFKKEWEAKDFLEWNLPEYLAYKEIQ
jgi:hypothetical protein